MILIGSQRSGASDLAGHLLKEENDHVQVYEVRGFISEDLHAAFKEAEAISRGTRCKQFLFSLSLSPPERERVSVAAFETAIDQAETRLGLTGQPRAIVIHEKEGRRHAHAVWSRIDAHQMKAVQMSFFKRELNTLSRELYLEHGWKMPPGLTDPTLSDPRNFTLAEWQQAQRAGKDARAIKAAFQDAWAISDSRAAFQHALKERGYMLARGDRRGFVGVDHKGEVYSVARQVGAKTKMVRQKLGDISDLPSVAEAKNRIAKTMLPLIETFKQSLETRAIQHGQEFERRKAGLITRQRKERLDLQMRQKKRLEANNRLRQSRFRQGLKGLWDRLRGEHKRVAEQNRREAARDRNRDLEERENLVFRHLGERQQLGARLQTMRHQYGRDRQRLERNAQSYRRMGVDTGGSTVPKPIDRNEPEIG